MRIIAIRVRPVCIAFTCLYAIVGLFGFIQFCFLESMQQFTFPIGILTPFIYFTINLHVDRLTMSSLPVVYVIAAVVAYAISGFITGFIGTYMFNFIANIMGGIDARFVKTTDDQLPPESDHSQSA